jgi:gluconolactonase
VTLGEPLVPLAALETLAHGLDHPEGIAVTPDGTIFVGGEAGQLFRIEADGTFTEVMTTGGFLLGLAADADGRIYACDTAERCVWRIDPASQGAGAAEVYSRGAPGRPFRTPNWGCFDARGNLYVSDSGEWKEANGAILVVRPGGATEVWTEESHNFPNGMALSPDGSRLYVLESTPGALVEFDIHPDGTAGTRRLVTELEGTVPDGIVPAMDGSLVIACYRPDAVLRWRADLGIQVLAHDPEGTVLAAPTNVVFTGPELDTIVVPNIGRWHLTRFRVEGLRGVSLQYPRVGA